MPDVLCQHSKFVLWNLLVLQMFFRWICGGESGLPFLFLHHLRTPKHFLYLTWWKKFLADVREGKQSSSALLYSVNEACVLNWKRQMNREGRGGEGEQCSFIYARHKHRGEAGWVIQRGARTRSLDTLLQRMTSARKWQDKVHSLCSQLGDKFGKVHVWEN